jgi:ABC-2 type transport system permease protein
MTQTLTPEPAVTVPKPKRSQFSVALVDCRVLVGRDLRHLIRNPEQLISAFSVPVVLLLLFRYLLGGAIKTDGQSYINYVIAGLFVLSVGLNATATAVGTTDDLSGGIIERFRSMPMPVSAVLVAHVISAVLRSFMSIAVMIPVALGIGFRPHAGIGAWAGALAMLLLFVTAISWLAVILGIIADTPEGASGLGIILFFLPYLSSAIVPVSTMPAVVGAVARNDPFTPVVDTVRSLLTGTPVGNSAWLGTVWWLGIMAVAAPAAAILFRRRAAR